MIKQIIKYLNHEIDYSNQENTNDFNMNIIVNLISNELDINKLFKIMNAIVNKLIPIKGYIAITI